MRSVLFFAIDGTITVCVDYKSGRFGIYSATLPVLDVYGISFFLIDNGLVLIKHFFHRSDVTS